MSKIKIGVTFTEARYEHYPLWIQGGDDNIEVIMLSHEQENQAEVEDCDGVILSGGIDVFPAFYNSDRNEYPFAPTSFNIDRDEFEMHIFEAALNLGLPVLGICRGLQLVNVSLGGGLIQDLEESGKSDHRRHEDTDGSHGIVIAEDTLLSRVTGVMDGRVNSAHHQALADVSEELMANCHSEDGVIEGAEWRDKEGKPWMLAVQWHPERMNDREWSPLSKNIRDAFLKAVRGSKG